MATARKLRCTESLGFPARLWRLLSRMGAYRQVCHLFSLAGTPVPVGCPPVKVSLARARSAAPRLGGGGHTSPPLLDG